MGEEPAAVMVEVAGAADTCRSHAGIDQVPVEVLAELRSATGCKPVIPGVDVHAGDSKSPLILGRPEQCRCFDAIWRIQESGSVENLASYRLNYDVEITKRKPRKKLSVFLTYQ